MSNVPCVPAVPACPVLAVAAHRPAAGTARAPATAAVGRTTAVVDAWAAASPSSVTSVGPSTQFPMQDSVWSVAQRGRWWADGMRHQYDARHRGS